MRHGIQASLDLPPLVKRWADISECGRYRYTLGRRWAPGPMLGWVALNPSTADADQEDATSRRFRGFSDRDGYGAYEVVNLDAFRATDPKDLRGLGMTGSDVVGPKNDITISGLRRADAIVLAWGSNGHHRLTRARFVLDGLEGLGKPLVCLGYTQAGHPVHPLRIRRDQPMVRFERRGELAR